jgi:plasmid stability protein
MRMRTSPEGPAERTTVTLPGELARRVRFRARIERRSVSSILREALEAYLEGAEPPPMPSFVGIGESGRSDTSERAEEILREQMGDVRG